MMKLKIEEFIKKLGRKEMDLPEEFKLKMPCRSDEPTGITHLPENVEFGGYFYITEIDKKLAALDK